MKSITIYIFVCLSVIFFVLKDVNAADIYGKYGVVFDIENNEVLIDKRAKEKAYPASLTKIMTSILLLEKVEDGKRIKLSKNAARKEKSNNYFFLKEGEEISKEDALYALMIISANDVATGVAEHISGSEEAFSKLMNDKAKEIGMLDTHFVTSSGLHDVNHYSTAYDMALLGKEALKYPSLIKAMNTKEYKITTNEKEITIKNRNKISENKDALGGKTGYTSMAGNTLLEIIEKDNKRVVAVVMKTTLQEEYKDIEKLTDSAFIKLKKHFIIKKDEILATELIKGGEIDVKAIENFVVYSTEEYASSLEREFVYEKMKGIAIGEIVGKVVIKRNGHRLAEIKLKASDVRYDSKRKWLNLLIAFSIPVAFYAFSRIRRKK